MFGARIHRGIYLSLLALAGFSLVTSQGLSNVAWVALAANWLLEGRWREKWAMARGSRLLQAFAALWLAFCIGAFACGDVAVALNALRIRLALFAVPLVVLTTPPVEGRERRWLLWLYAATVLGTTLIGTVRLATIEGLPYREAVPFVSHIRFALNCCMVVYLCLLEPLPGRWRWAGYALALWTVAYLVIIRSYTAFAMLGMVWLVVIVCHRRRWPWVAAWCTVAVAVAAVAVGGCYSYYRMAPLAQQPLAALTAGGRPYEHHNDGIVENGNYVNNYICREELRQEWPRRSAVPLDSIGDDGYSREPVLIRYLNALGLPKDSVGVAALTDAQVADIERGEANPVYAHGNIFKRMLFVALFEYENRHNSDIVTDFSMLQRLEVWRAGWNIVAQRPWFGWGVVDLHVRVADELERMDSPLKGTGIHLHSQYLAWLIMTGFVGCVAVGLMFLRAAPALRRQPPLILAWVLTVLLSFTTELTLGVVAERLFCTWFLAFRLSQACLAPPGEGAQ